VALMGEPERFVREIGNSKREWGGVGTTKQRKREGLVWWGLCVY
jgi:hypothetical protein